MALRLLLHNLHLMMRRIFLEGMMPQSDSVFGRVETDLNTKKYSSAMMKLTVLSREYSKDIQFLNLLGQTQKALGDFRGLIKTLDVIAKTTDASDDHMQLMQALYAEGRLNEALDVGLLLQERSVHPALYKDLSRCLVKIYLEFSDYEGAQELAQAQQETDDFMMWALGLISLAQDQQEQALTWFRKALEANSANDNAWVSLASVHEQMGDHELAVANLERALEINPHNTAGLKLLARCHHQNLEQVKVAMERVRYYLSRHSFDEEMSLCYVQMLKSNNALAGADFELQKLILNNPSKTQYQEMKKNLEDSLKM